MLLLYLTGKPKNMSPQTNIINWFEIPVSDMARAKHFYETIFGIEMYEETIAGTQMAYFPGEPGSGKVSGALALSPDHKPTADGVVVYLNANPAMNPIMDKVTEAGGTVLMPRTLITPEIGYMAFFFDTEGNKMALHSTEGIHIPIHDMESVIVGE